MDTRVLRMELEGEQGHQETGQSTHASVQASSEQTGVDDLSLPIPASVITTPSTLSAEGRSEVLRKLKREAVRLRTFATWTSTLVTPEALARAGFFYFNQGDEVQCAFCLGVLRRWEPMDEPMSEHRRNFPRCCFVIGLPVGNIPIGGPPPPPTLQFDVSLIERRAPRVNSEEGATSSQRVTRSMMGASQNNPFIGKRMLNFSWGHLKESDLYAGGTISTRLDTYQISGSSRLRMESLSDRVKTFDKWPFGTKVSEFALASAGFIYTETSDQVCCLQCGIHLRGWSLNHTPLKEHQMWSPNCPFLEEMTNIVPSTGEDVTGRMKPFKRTHSERVDESGDAAFGPCSECCVCKVCFDAVANCVILPCGHMCACVQCLQQISKCPMCRRMIKTVVKAYF